MKVYIAGPLFRKDAQRILEKIDKLCKELKLETYLPHRDTGVYEKGDSIPFFKVNRDMVDKCDFMIAYLDWKGISSGTAWEIGYAHAKKVPIIGLVEDIKTAKEFDRLCIMCFNSVDLVETFEDLKDKIKEKINGS
jgi:nucleoside 2-deoxyribosyltransferase